jgi:hypothetical protein
MTQRQMKFISFMNNNEFWDNPFASVYKYSFIGKFPSELCKT